MEAVNAEEAGRMKFGIHSLLFNETFTEKDLPVLDKCKALGFDTVEIIPFDLDHFPPSKVRAAARDLGLSINIGYGLPEEFNLISADSETRKRGIAFSRTLVDMSVDAGAELLCGVVYCAWGYLTGKMRTPDEWKWGVEAFRQVAQYAQRSSKMILGIEPVNRFESHFINTAADAVKFIEEVDMPNVKVHLDTFHMIREEASIAGAVKETGSHLGYIHACENHRGIPGRGLMPWKEFFDALRETGYDGCITVESFDPNMQRIAKLCCIWRELADSPEQLATEGLRFLKQTYQEAFA